MYVRRGQHHLWGGKADAPSDLCRPHVDSILFKCLVNGATIARTQNGARDRFHKDRSTPARPGP